MRFLRHTFLLLLLYAPALSYPIHPQPQSPFRSAISKLTVNPLTIDQAVALRNHRAHPIHAASRLPPARARAPTFRHQLAKLSVKQAGGLTIDPCSEDSDCNDPRVCGVPNDFFDVVRPCPTNGNQRNCVCLLPGGNPECSVATECGDGEVCAATPALPGAICVSEQSSVDDGGFVIFENLEGGLNGEACVDDDSCQGARVCTENVDELLDCREGRDCFCFPVFVPFCEQDDECDEGEECRDTGLDNNVCFTLSGNNFLDQEEEDPTPAPAPPPVQRPIPGTDPSPEESPEMGGGPAGPSLPGDETGDGLDPTQMDFGGDVSMEPEMGPGSGGVPSDEELGGQEQMVPMESIAPSESMGPLDPMGPDESMGAAGEVPSGADGEIDVSPTPVIGDETAVPEPEDTIFDPALEASAGPSAEATADAASTAQGTDAPAAICVDVELLEEFSREELVFEKDSMARVWCDAGGSCATGGHMVVWQGRAMMMKRYCGLVEGGCVRREMLVNSPRWRRGRRVRGRQDGGVEFTTFAARWETRAEEGVLAAAVRMGL